MKFICQLCMLECDSLRKMAKHINNFHKVKSIDYYDQFMKTENEGICSYCCIPTKFQTIAKGYYTSCRACRSYKAKDFRKQLKLDTTKYNNFVKKVSKNQSEIWKHRVACGTSQLIHDTAGKTHRIKNSQLSIEERKNRFGWRNTATEQQKLNATKKLIETRLKITSDLTVDLNLDPTNYKKYQKLVYHLTNITYGRYRDIIDPTNLRGNGYDLDHCFSVKAGFVYNIDPLIISNKNNLCILPSLINKKKGINCSISLTELLETYNE